MSANPDNPFDEFGGAENTDGTRAPYRPSTARRSGRARRWIVTGLIVFLVILLTIPVLGMFGIQVWPKNKDEFDAVALTNQHGGTVGVYFSGRTTKDEATLVGQILIEGDAIGGAAGGDVMLDRDGDVVVVSVFGHGTTEPVVERFRVLRQRISDNVSGVVVIDICDPMVAVALGKVHRSVRLRIT